MSYIYKSINGNKHMKLTNEQKQQVKKAISKKWNISEGFIERLFAKGLAKNLKGDKEFQRLAKNVDDAFLRLQKKAEERKKQGKPVPKSWQQFLDAKK